MNIQEYDPNGLIAEAAKLLQSNEQMKQPQWSEFVKTGVSKERPPMQRNWWHLRTASIMRKVMIYGPVGTCKLRRMYGSKKNRGVKKEKFFRGSGAIVRRILQQCENCGYMEHVKKGTFRGRVLTKEGIAVLAEAAKHLRK